MRIYKLSQITIPKAPSGECFRNARKWASDNDSENTTIVHGKVTNIQNKTFDHAWVEKGDIVIDPTLGITMGKRKYYDLIKAKPEAVYSVEQANINTVRSNNSGPWTIKEVGKRFINRIDA